MRLPITSLILVLVLCPAASVTPQSDFTPSRPALAARDYRTAHDSEILAEFAALLALPNVASDAPNIRRNAEAIRLLLERRGVRTQLLEAPDAPPVVYGEIPAPGATRTVVFYAHYDGQPVEPAKWAGGDPFKPVLRSSLLDEGGRELPWPKPGERIDPEWRIYGRSTSDDKAPIIALASALDALRAAQIPLGANIKFFFEGEEEAGSPHLEQIVDRYRDLLKADLWLICDGPVDQTRRQQIYFGVRGVTSIDLTVYGPRRELHSGHYGNWAPNPAIMLAQLLASMKNEDGRVMIEGYYDGIEPLGEAEKRALAEAPAVDALLKRELGLARTEGGGRSLMEMLALPSLNIRGLDSGSVGETARNIVPSTATAAIDIRLVKGIDYRAEVDRVVAHIRRQGYHIVETEPDEATRLKYPKVIRVVRHSGYNAARTPMDLPVSQSVIRTVEGARGRVTKMPTLGGSVPLYIFTDILKTPTIGIPIANHDNNQHSSNENLRLQNLWDGIEVMAALLAMK